MRQRRDKREQKTGRSFRQDGGGRIRCNFSWRSRLMGMIMLVALLLFSLSFISSYEIFIKQLEETNLKSTTLAFDQTEHNIDLLLAQASESANRLLAQKATFDFLGDEMQTLPEKTLAARQASDAMDNCISNNPDLAGMVLIDGRGRGLGVTSWGMTIVSQLKKEAPAYRFLQNADSRYPYYIWYGGSEVMEQFSGTPDFSGFFGSSSTYPVKMLAGVRLISYGSQDENSAYLMLAVKAEALQECWSQVLYSQNTMVLLDQNGRVISAMDDRASGLRPSYSDMLLPDNGISSFSFRSRAAEDYQIIYSSIPQYGWTLLNEIPKSSYRKQAHDLKLLLLFLWFFTLSLMLVFFVIWIGKYTRPVERIILSMKRVQEGDLSPVQLPPSGIREMDELGGQFAITVSTIDNLISRVRTMDRENAEEELRTLQYQINPHFLYNSLTSIRWMAILNNNPKIAEALLLLARIIEPILRSPSFYWTVGEELEFVGSYVQMLTLRFGGALAYEAECAPDLKSRTFPRLTLQPLLENCFTHGMIPGDTLHIKVILTSQDGMLCARVINTGKQIEPEKLTELNHLLERRREPDATVGSIGLLNVNKRLFLLYGMKASMRILSDERLGTTVVLEIPDEVPGQASPES